MKIFLVLSVILSSLPLFAQDLAQQEGKESKLGNKKVIYTYKQFEKFDFDDLNIEGDTGAPNDLSISPIHEKRFTNHLPYRKSFTVEIKKGIERVR
jgi:hypothetical protein